MRVVLLVVAFLLASQPAFSQQTDMEARAAYATGKLAYEGGDYAHAYEAFKRSYTLSGSPALLYNIASALEHLQRPGEAANALRDYVRLAHPDDQSEIEARITQLDIAQKLIDTDHHPAPAPKRRPWYTRWYVWTPVAVVVVGAGLGVGLGVGLQGTKYPATPSTAAGTFQF